jgi:pilus assembly protein CpaC
VNQGNAVNGIPGLDTTTVSTTVDLREGQWFAIAGLVQDSQTGSESRVPFLGTLPGLNFFFSNRSITREESELLVLVSPEFVHPLEPEEAPLLLPGMEVTEPNNLDFYLCGKYEGNPECHHRSTVWPIQQERVMDAHYEAMAQARQEIAYEKTHRNYQECEEYYLRGPLGFSR